MDKTLDLLLTKYLRALITYEGVQRVENYPMPEVALREVVLNAIAHKDYASGAPIQISVYDDKLMLWNPGHLPTDWTVERLTEKHSSQPYNPDVANAFFRAGMIESWGRGIERVQWACEHAEVPAPQWRVEQTGVWVVFTYPTQTQRLLPESQPESQPESSSQRTRVLMLLAAAGPQSKSALSVALGHRQVTGHLNQLIRSLLAEGLLAHTLPGKPRSRLQQYRLTTAGDAEAGRFQSGDK